MFALEIFGVIPDPVCGVR